MASEKRPLMKDDPLAEKTVGEFKKRFGYPPRIVSGGPGRVNLIGEHTDYQMGFVCPIALDRKTVVAIGQAEAQQKKIRICSLDLGIVEWDELPSKPDATSTPWWAYVVGTIRIFCSVSKTPVPTSLDVVIATDVPLGGGLSSSAALEMATATAMEGWTGVQLAVLDKAELVCQKAEHDWAHMPCGLMDQAISAMGQAGHAMLFDCESKKAKHFPLPDEVRVIVVDSGVRHKLVEGHYAARKQKCQEAVTALKKKHSSVRYLRHATLSMLEECKGDMDEEAYRRATHVINECSRCVDFTDKLQRGEWKAAGAVMLEGHTSLRDLYDVSIPEIDEIVEIAKTIEGVYGARITGGGFGGCVVVLVQRDAAERILSTLMDKYAPYLKSRREGYQNNSNDVVTKTPSAFVVKASRGAHLYDGVA